MTFDVERARRLAVTSQDIGKLSRRIEDACDEVERLEEQLEATQLAVKRYVVEISRAPGNRDEEAILAASEALVAVISYPANQHQHDWVEALPSGYVCTICGASAPGVDGLPCKGTGAEYLVQQDNSNPASRPT